MTSGMSQTGPCSSVMKRSGPLGPPGSRSRIRCLLHGRRAAGLRHAPHDLVRFLELLAVCLWYVVAPHDVRA
eukprot:1075241-Prymnesium_polylepis.1